jgi:hypothetical protein
VHPLNDLIAHDTTGADCVCGPSYERVDTVVGDGWLVVHASLDGRELEDGR